eukprot:1369698-Alexandrium_andersonii.AAC.1
MSASLVGSEMCIRDRVRRGHRRGSPSARAVRPIGRARTATSHGGLGGAVSYTHLTLPTICSV